MTKNKAGDYHVWRRHNLDGSYSWKVRPWRWMICLGLLGAFILSYSLDIQMLEGSMIASRLMGFHLVDLFSGFEVMGAHGELPTNLLMGMIFVGAVYFILGGRSFCSWACPYGLLSEWGESIHRYLVEKRLISKRKKITTSWKYFIALCFLVASFLSGYLVYQYVNLVGIVSRIFIYGLIETAVIVLLVLFVEVFFYRRLWCRSICPSGATFGLLGKVSLIRIQADKSKCDKCGSCVPECHVPETLKPVFEKGGQKIFLMSTDCTMCGKCIDVCNRDVFSYNHRLSKLV